MISYLDSKMLQEQEIIRIKDYAERLAKTEAGVIAPDFTLTTLRERSLFCHENEESIFC